MALDYGTLRTELLQRGLDFDRLADGRGKPIEDKIKPLLLVLNYFGYQTIASCEGHRLGEHKNRIHEGSGVIIEEDKYHYVLEKQFGKIKGKIYVDSAPFVDLRITSEQLQRLESIIDKYNSTNIIPWKFDKIESNFRFSPEYTHAFEDLQNSIPPISELIYAKHQNFFSQ